LIFTFEQRYRRPVLTIRAMTRGERAARNATLHYVKTITVLPEK
jgi:hypothetical protein